MSASWLLWDAIVCVLFPENGVRRLKYLHSVLFVSYSAYNITCRGKKTKWRREEGVKETSDKVIRNHDSYQRLSCRLELVLSALNKIFYSAISYPLHTYSISSPSRFPQILLFLNSSFACPQKILLYHSDRHASIDTEPFLWRSAMLNPWNSPSPPDWYKMASQTHGPLPVVFRLRSVLCERENFAMHRRTLPFMHEENLLWIFMWPVPCFKSTRCYPLLGYLLLSTNFSQANSDP